MPPNYAKLKNSRAWHFSSHKFVALVERAGLQFKQSAALAAKALVAICGYKAGGDISWVK